MYNKLLVTLDGSKLAECVLPHIENIIKGCDNPEVIFIRVVEPYYMPSGGDDGSFSEDEIEQIDSDNAITARNYLIKLTENLNYNARIQYEVIMGKPAEVITEYTSKNDIDLIIIATHGRSGISRWVMGSVADRVLRSSCAPVLMIRAPGCISGI